MIVIFVLTGNVLWEDWFIARTISNSGCRASVKARDAKSE